MKKSILTLMSQAELFGDGQLKGGFIAIKGGAGLTLHDNAGCTNYINCTNQGNCNSTNNSGCSNSGDCSSTTNDGSSCTNSTTCAF